MNRKIIVIILSVLLIGLSACNNAALQNSPLPEISPASAESSAPEEYAEESNSSNEEIGNDNSVKSSVGIVDFDKSTINRLISQDKNVSYSITNERFTELDSTIEYPVILYTDNIDIQEKVNKIIYDSATCFYSKDYPSNLEITYEIVFKNVDIISICFSGYQYYTNTPHPHNHYYTLNIDLNEGRIIPLDELLSIDKEFYKRVLDNAECITIYEDGKSMTSVINLLNNEIDEGVWDSDSGSGENPSLKYYLTSVNLGLCFSVPYAFGSHIEFEIPYDEIAEWLKQMDNS